MNKETFINSGRFTDLKTFLNLFPKEHLHQDCTDVVLYEGGNYIQLLKTGEYMFGVFKDKSLEKVEDFLWKIVDNI